MNGLVFGTSSHAALEADILRGGPARLSAFALAHNVASQNEVQPTLDRLSAVGGRILSKWRGAAADPPDDVGFAHIGRQPVSHRSMSPAAWPHGRIGCSPP